MKEKDDSKVENVDVSETTLGNRKDLQKLLLWTESQRNQFFQDLANLSKVDKKAAEELANKYMEFNESIFQEAEEAASKLNRNNK